MKLRITFLLCAVLFYSAQTWGQTYNPGDIAVINAMIDNNGLQWTKADPADGSYVPADWTGVFWSADTTKRIASIKFYSTPLTGALDVSGLLSLNYLSCASNHLTSLDVSGLPSLATLYCYDNELTSLNVSGVTNLLRLYCSSNELTSLDVSGLTNLGTLDCSSNHLTSLDLMGINIRSFHGFDQTSSIDFTDSTGNYTANVTFGSGATFSNAALSYSAGVLTSASATATTSDFSSPTGKEGMELTGTLTMTYTHTPIYNPGDIAVINAMIDNNGLQWTKANPADGSYVPADWTRVTWSADTTKRIIGLSISNSSLTGALDVSGLTNLETLDCSGNHLIWLDLTGKNITSFYGFGQTSSIDFTGSAGNYTANVTFGSGATFSNTALSYNAGMLTSVNDTATTSDFTSPTGKEGMELTGTLTMTYLATTPIYHPGDIAVINAIIDNNGLRWTKANPADGSYVPANWTGVSWMADHNTHPPGGFIKRITGLNISSESLTGALDVSGLTNLETLKCYGNNLTSLDVSGLTYLETLECYGNNLTSLDVSGLPSLRYLYCYNNELTSLDLTGLNLSGLFYCGLYCGNNHLTSLDLTGVSLSRLYCENNELTSLDLTGLNLLSLSCGNNHLTSLDVSELTNLMYLYCSNNELTSLDLTGLTHLYELWCYDNELTSLNVSGFLSFESLDCSNNKLTSLNILGSPLDRLNCSNNKLTSLDLTGNYYLGLFYGSGQTVSIDFTGSTGNYTANATFGSGATFGNTALSYSAGVLTSASDTATTSGFTSPTGGAFKALTGTLTMTYPVGSAIGEVGLPAETFACLNNGTLYIQSPVAETVQIYSTNGVLLYSVQKPAGMVNYPLNQLKATALIVKGSSGWVRKAIR